MYATLLKHQWLAAIRSNLWGRRVIFNILYGLFALYFLATFVLIAWALHKVITGNDEVDVVLRNIGRFFYFYWQADLLTRYLFSNSSTLSTDHYLHLPIKRSTLVHYLLSKGLFNLFTLLFLLVGTYPILFGVSQIAGPLVGIGLFVFLLGSLLFNNLIVSYLKRRYGFNFIGMAVGLGVAAGLVALETYEVLPISRMVGKFTELVLYPYPAVAVVFVLIPAAVYALNYNWLITKLYPGGERTKAVSAFDVPWLQRFGTIGELIVLEIKLLIRHKRSKGVVVVSAIFVAYGLVFYTNDAMMTGLFIRVFIASFVSGMFMMNYGQFVPAWESGYFDYLLAGPIQRRVWLQSKYYLLVSVTFVATILSLAYGFFDVQNAIDIACLGIYNIGVNVYVVLAMGAYNHKRIDMSKSPFMNWQGVGGNQFLLMLPIMGLPFIVIIPFWAFMHTNYGFYALGGIGLLGIATQKIWMDRLTLLYEEKRYLQAAGFRSKE